jgi:hypothetical protein
MQAADELPPATVAGAVKRKATTPEEQKDARGKKARAATLDRPWEPTALDRPWNLQP